MANQYHYHPKYEIPQSLLSLATFSMDYITTEAISYHGIHGGELGLNIKLASHHNTFVRYETKIPVCQTWQPRKSNSNEICISLQL